MAGKGFLRTVGRGIDVVMNPLVAAARGAAEFAVEQFGPDLDDGERTPWDIPKNPTQGKPLTQAQRRARAKAMNRSEREFR